MWVGLGKVGFQDKMFPFMLWDSILYGVISVFENLIKDKDHFFPRKCTFLYPFVCQSTLSG